MLRYTKQLSVITGFKGCVYTKQRSVITGTQGCGYTTLLNSGRVQLVLYMKTGNRGKIRKIGYRGKYWNGVNIERGKYRKREENMEKIRIDKGNLEKG